MFHRGEFGLSATVYPAATDCNPVGFAREAGFIDHNPLGLLTALALTQLQPA